MKKSFFLLAFGLLFLGLACMSDNSEAQKEALREVILSSPNKEASVPGQFSDLFYPNTGVFRGIDFTMDKGRVKALESGRPLDETNTELKYTININLDPEDFVDYAYEFDEKGLARIVVDIYSSNEAQAQATYEEVTTMFDRKYKKRAELWDGAEKGVPFSAFVSITEEDPGVTIIWERIETI
jgi:hypothetical protein